jgi:hypothetical protein
MIKPHRLRLSHNTCDSRPTRSVSEAHAAISSLTLRVGVRSAASHTLLRHYPARETLDRES